MRNWNFFPGYYYLPHGDRYQRIAERWNQKMIGIPNHKELQNETI